MRTAEVFDEYPSERTVLPDEMSEGLIVVAYAISAAGSYTMAGWYEPLIPETLGAAVLAFPMWLFSYIVLHYVTGRPWVVEGDQCD